MKQSEIKFTVSLDENHLPDRIQWEATDSGEQGIHDCKSIMLSIWDGDDQNTLRIDLWTKEMKVDEMKLFFHQTLVSMANTLHRATNDDEVVKEVRDFANNLASKMDLIVNKK